MAKEAHRNYKFHRALPQAYKGHKQLLGEGASLVVSVHIGHGDPGTELAVSPQPGLGFSVPQLPLNHPCS